MKLPPCLGGEPLLPPAPGALLCDGWCPLLLQHTGDLLQQLRGCLIAGAASGAGVLVDDGHGGVEQGGGGHVVRDASGRCSPSVVLVVTGGGGTI